MFAQWPYQFITVTGFLAWYARRPCCNMRNLQRLWRHGVTTSHHLTLDIFQQVLPPAGRRKQSENHDQCIGTFGQSRSPDSRGCLGVWLAGRWSWMVDISWYILSTRCDKYLKEKEVSGLNGHKFMYTRTSWVHQDFAYSLLFIYVDASNLFLVFSQNSRPVTFKQPVKLNKTRKVSDISNQATNQPTTVCPSD